MKFLNVILILLTCLLSSNAFSFGFNYPNNKKGFSIYPNYPTGNGIVQKSGDTFTFEGDICVIKWGINSEDRKNEKCYKVVDEKLNFKAYFPDEISDVTADTQITYDKSKKKWHYKFTTPALSKGKLNRFTFVIGSRLDREVQLQNAKAKIDQLIIYFKNRKEIVLNSTDLKDKQKHLDFINNAITRLQNMIVGIDKALENSVNTLSHISIPLQVDNEKASAFSYSSNFSGQKMSVTMNPGVVFEGETVSTNLRVTNLSHLEFSFPLLSDDKEDDDFDNDINDDGSNYYSASFLFNKISKFSPETFLNDFGFSYEKSIDLSRVQYCDSNDFYYVLNRVLPRKFFFEENNKLQRKWGSLSGMISVADDTVPPTMQRLVPDPSKKYFQNLPEIHLAASDARGKIEKATFKFQLNGKKVNGDLVNIDLSSNALADTSDFGQNYYFTIPLPALDEGDYSFSSEVSDYAGNKSNVVLGEFHIDRTPPVVNLGVNDNILTNKPDYSVPTTTIDHSPVRFIIELNGEVITQTELSSNLVNSFDVKLEEGLNFISISAIDAAGNFSTSVGLESVTLDTIPPKLSNILPQNNSFTSFLKFPVVADSEEPLSKVYINDVDANIVNGSNKLNSTYQAEREGPVELKIAAFDMAGNEANYTINLEILQKIIRPELISIFPDPNDPTEIIIQGSKYATRPGVEVSTGVLGLFFTVADSEGKFQFKMPARSEIVLVATDKQLNKTDYAYLTYQLDTTFSGLVYSIDGKPLPGVKVTINSTKQSATTDAYGAFSILKPATGDQIVSFDANGFSESDGSTVKVYNKTNVAFTLGNNQTNVLTKPIVLVPLTIDGNETSVVANSSATVTNSNVEGFSLDIAANNATFPSGLKTGEISVQKIAAENVNVPPPAYVKPKNVYSLEPSGLTFSTPAKLVLPNENEFPAKAQLVIMSKNSVSGIWEIDGLATVSSDGNSIETVDGGGITHFSEVFAAPIAPKLSAYNSDATNGAVINNNGSKASATLPSIKIMGQDLAPTLNYNSAWANPKMIVSNIISVDRQERTIGRTPNGSRKINGTNVEIEFEGKSWVEPDKVYAWAATGETASQKYLFSGVPNNSLISYALDLSNTKSGYQSYLSQYEIQLKQLTIGTVYVTPKGGLAGLFGDTQTSPYESSQVIEELFPQAFSGNLIVQNKINSMAGRGWKLGLTKEIIDVNAPVISVEGEDGSVKTYHANNRINTLYTETTDDLTSISGVHSSGSKISIATTKGKVKDINLADGSISKESTLQSYSGSIGYNYLAYAGTYKCSWTGKRCARYVCYNRQVSYDSFRQFSSFFKKSDGSYIGSDINGALFKLTPTSTSIVAGNVNGMTSGSSGYMNSVCGTPGISCYNDTYLGQYNTPGCGGPPGSSGQRIYPGYANGLSSVAQFNNITDIAEVGGYILVADSGNNRIRMFDPSSDSVSTFAGNGQIYDGGDGSLAINASFFHPLGIVSDNSGNVYVSTENGYIRKIDSSGYISTIAGKPVTLGGKVVMNGPAREMALVKPYGMVVDNSKNTLYVADSGNNRVLAINLSSLQASTVAGDGTCSQLMKDNIPATAASLCSPEKVTLDQYGNLLVFDKGHKSIRRINFSSNVDQKLAFFTLDKDGSMIERNTDKTFVLKQRNGSVTTFDKKGRQIDTVSRSGNRFDYQYNIDGQLETVQFENKNIFTIEYDNGLISSITDKAGRSTYFNIVDGVLQSVEYPDGTAENYTYDSEGKILTAKDKLSRVSSYGYNAYGELTSVMDAKGNIVGKGFGQSKVVGGAFTEYNDPAVKDYVADPKGNTVELNKDFKGYVSTVIDQRGLKTTIDRDTDGRPLKITRPDNTYVQFTYDQNYFDLVKKYDSGTSVTLEYNYNDYGDLLSTLENSVVMKENSYDDTTGHLLSETNKMLNQTISYQYQELGLVSKKILPDGSNSQFEYDEWGNLNRSIDARGASTDLFRDSAGNVTKIINSLAQNTLREYDLFNRLTAVTTSKLEKTNYQYSLTGQLIKIIDPNEKVTSFLYNELDQLIQKTTPDNFVTNLEYDSNGNVVNESDSSGRNISYEYNKINKITKKILPDDSYEFSYDIRGNITTAKNDATQVNFTYQKLEKGDVVTKVESFGRGLLNRLPSSTLDYEFDLHGNRIKMTERSQSTNYQFDAGDRLVQITNHKGEKFEFNYDNKNRITDIIRPGSSTAYDFYENDMLKSISHSNSSEVVSSFGFVTNTIGNITNITTKKGTHSFGYDQNNQLTSSSNPELQNSEIYTYDSLGNRITSQDGDYVYNDTKQKLSEDPKNIFAYDLRGNVISKTEKQTGQVHKYYYNSEDRLVKYELLDIGSNLIKDATYDYDVLGRRIEKVVHNYTTNVNKTRRFVYDGQEVLLDLDEDNNVLSKFTHSMLRTDDVLSTDVTDLGEQKGYALKGSYQYLKDHLGSVVDITDNTGNIVQHFVYSAFGEIKKVTDKNGNELSNPILEHHFAFTGREFDEESNLYFYRARSYDPQVGRFFTIDPHSGELINPISHINKNIYVGNSPIMFNDPSGKFAPILIGALVGIAINEIFDLEFSVFQAALIGASAGYFSALTIEGMSTIKTLGFIGQSAVSFSVGMGIGGFAGVTTSLLLGAITGNDTLKNNAGDAGYIGMGAGIGGAFTEAFFAASIEEALLTRIDLLPTPLKYMATYPAEVVGITLLATGAFLCNGVKIPVTGGSCAF